MSRCRTCKTQRWRGDPCTNPDCLKNVRPLIRIKSRTLPMTIVKHGYHGLNTAVRLVDDYDLPISAHSRGRRG